MQITKERKTSLLKHDVSKLRSFFDDVKTFFRLIKKKFLKILKNMKIYRNTFVFIFFASLTIDVFEQKNAKNRHFCAMRAEFTSNSNEHRFSIYFDD